MLPEALLGRTEGHGNPRPRPRGLQLKLSWSRDEVGIGIEGGVDGETILEDLGLILEETPGQPNLRLDLSRATGMDHLALSALVVVLRDQEGRFNRIALQGLPPWATQRLRLTGVDNLLGRWWRGSFQPGLVLMDRRFPAAQPAAEGPSQGDGQAR